MTPPRKKHNKNIKINEVSKLMDAPISKSEYASAIHYTSRKIGLLFELVEKDKAAKDL